MTIETYTRAQLARFAIEEGARHGGVNNMLAIAHVLRNRVFAGWGDWLEVVMTAGEKRGNQYAPDMPNIRTTNVRVLLNKVDEIYTRADANDLTGGALFYCEPNLPLLAWFESEVLRRPEDHPRAAHIGPVWFYK
jgi:hypothetical protein